VAQKVKFKFSDLKKSTSSNKEIDVSGIDPEYLSNDDSTPKDPSAGKPAVKKSTRKTSMKSESAPQPKLYEDMTDFKKQISNLVDMYAQVKQELADHITESHTSQRPPKNLFDLLEESEFQNNFINFIKSLDPKNYPAQSQIIKQVTTYSANTRVVPVLMLLKKFMEGKKI
jgi:hypothetical protein